MTYLKINDTQHQATFRGYTKDREWDGRASKAITVEMTYEEAMETFVDDLEWAIVYKDGEVTEVYDNSEYSVAGPVTDNRNGTVTVKMGKITDAELLAILTGGN